MVNGSSKTQARLNKAGIASELRPFMVFVVRHFHFLERSLSAALSKTSIFMPNKWHTMGLGSLCISTFQNFLVVGSMPSSLASLVFQALECGHGGLPTVSCRRGCGHLGFHRCPSVSLCVRSFVRPTFVSCFIVLLPLIFHPWLE